MSTDKKNLLLLFDRPQEPVFVPKSDNRVRFDVPETYMVDRYKPIRVELLNRFGEEANKTIKVNQIPLPNLGEILDLGREENFSVFIEKHRRIAGRLIEIFLGMRNVDDLLSVAVYARDRVNPYLFNYSLSVALLHRPDTQDLDVPSLIHSFPDKLLDGRVFAKVREEASIVPEASRTPIDVPIDYSASDIEIEHRLAYFREDVAVNLHHWHWHLVYPFEVPSNNEIVNKNRRGELFYYMHQQTVARYNFERFSNKLKRVERLNDWRAPILEAYFPNLELSVGGKNYPPRVANLKLQNLNRKSDGILQDVDDLYRWRERILAAIHSGHIMNDEHKIVHLTEDEGIDILGNLVESSVLSQNRTFYGDIHNKGHVFIACIHDPDHRHLQPFGVMGDEATAMRDPIFYRWHAFIDELFQEYKATLPGYNTQQLHYPGVILSEVEVQSDGKSNQLSTFWQKSDIDISSGMNFEPRGATLVRFTHLQHQPFSYQITVNNRNAGNKMGTCRIFLAPKFDERGHPLSFRDQKNMFIELDKFTVTLQEGQNVITRKSTESSVTIPFELIFRKLGTNQPETGRASTVPNYYCRCGWPQHMLIPKGTPEGLTCQLFVMISNYEDDKVNQSVDGVMCKDAGSYCGIKDKLYPDRRAMGYPFDRLPKDGHVLTLQDFLTPNMFVQEVTIKFTDEFKKPMQ